MATDSIIPRRPAGIDIKIPGKDKDILEYSAAFNVPNNEAFLLFNPQFITADGKLNNEGKRRCRDFFSYSKNREYKEKYTELLKGIVGGQRQEGKSEELEGLTEERKANAVQLLLLQLVKMIEERRIDDPEIMKLVTDLSAKTKLLKEDIERVIAPIRVLMARCGECRYRIGVESMVLNGQMLDMCAYCKCRKTAEEHGYRFNDGKDLLEIPKEIIDELEAKNNVRMEDILSGKVDN